MSGEHDRRVARVAAPTVCTGSPRELGFDQGVAIAEQVRGSHRVLRELEAFQMMRPGWLPHGAFVRMAERRATRSWRRTISRACPGSAERAAGIAEGAGVRAGAVHLLNVLEPMMADLRDLTDAPPLGGCSALAVAATGSSGEPMIARNFDYLPLIQPYYLLRDSRPTAGLRSLDFTCAPLAGAVDGMNEAGLCITTNYAYVDDEPTGAGTISMAVAAALARCETVADAVAFLSNRPRWGGGLVMLADASGALASLELSNSRAAVRRPTPGDNGVLFHTNRFQSGSMRECELSRDARFTRRAPVPLRGKIVHDSAVRRFARFGELTSDRARLDPVDVERVMADHGPSGVPSNESICMHSDYWATTATLQFLPRSRRIRVAFDSACQARFSDFSLDAAGPGSVREVGDVV